MTRLTEALTIAAGGVLVLPFVALLMIVGGAGAFAESRYPRILGLSASALIVVMFVRTIGTNANGRIRVSPENFLYTVAVIVVFAVWRER